MTQNLLDTTTLLLNSTKSELNLGTSSKNYTETFSNGKSFNDILSTANNNLMKDNKLSSNTLSKNNNFNNNTSNNNNNNSKSLNEMKNTKTDINKNVSNPNKTTQNSSNQVKAKENDNNSLSKTDVNSTKSENVSAVKTTEADTTKADSTKETLSNDLEYEMNLAEVNVDLSDISDTESFDDLQDLNQLLLDDELENDTAQADFYINAYYQSTIDSLQQPETLDLEQDTLIQQDDLQTANLQDVNTLVTDVKEDTTKTLSLEDEESLSTTEVQDNLKTSVEAENVSKTTNKDLNSDKTKLKAEALETKDVKKENVTANNEKEQTSSLKDEKVEVDTFTNEESVNKTDVLVNASENVVQNVQAADVTKSDSKMSFRDVMEKAGLDEAKLEALKLNVTESSNGESFNGNLGQGSAQDDVAKIAFETQGKKDATNIQNKDFSKLVDKKQIVDEQPKEISKNDILNQVSNKMQAQNINGTKRIVLQLTPESLGKITVEIMKGKDGLQAKMLTDNFQVKELLEKNIDGLKSTLANQGVTVNNVSVKVASASESSAEFSFGRDNFGEENAQQNFAGTGDRRGENESHYEKNINPETAMEDETTENISTDNLNSEEDVLLDTESERIAVGAGNVDIEI